MSDLTLFVLEADLSDLPEGHLAKLEEILLRTQKSSLSQIEEVNSALTSINEIRRKRAGEAQKPQKQKNPPSYGFRLQRFLLSAAHGSSGRASSR